MGSSTSRHAVLRSCLATLTAHLPFLMRQLSPDEDGFAVVARFCRVGDAPAVGKGFSVINWVDIDNSLAMHS
jgi:hypothetical protein